jgi:hypothetical protein
MANATATKIVEEGKRNAVVQLTGILDTSNAALTSVIQLSNFTNKDAASGRFVGLRIDKISYSIGDQLQLTLHWKATTPQVIAAIAGRGHLKYKPVGGLKPNTGAAGFDGAINLATTGWASGTQNYTVLLEMVKIYT